MLRTIAIIVLLGAALLAGGCDPGISGDLGRERLFVPLLGFREAYLKIDLGKQTGSGGLLIKYLDFAGKRVALDVIPLPSHRSHWAGVLGGGAKKDGKPYYGLKIERFGESDGAMRYFFQPLAGPRPGPLGLFDLES